MTRILLFSALALGIAAYVFWVYLRVELRVPAARWLAAVRAGVMIVVLLLLFNPRLPIGDGAGAPARWVLLDASRSMAADDGAAWNAAVERASALRGQGWTVVRFGDASIQAAGEDLGIPDRSVSRLAPALEAAAEAGVRQARVLTDGRLDDAVAVRSALTVLPLDVRFERFGEPVPNAGIARLDVPDRARPDGPSAAEIEVFAEGVGDSVVVEVFEEDRPVATRTIAAPSAGLRATATVELPTPATTGRVRYTARVSVVDDRLADDDQAVAFATVGFEEGGLVLVSARPDWEPRQLLPVLERVTGLPASGYLRAGADRYLPTGRAADRAGPVDSATVRRAASGATILVVHGLHAAADPWLTRLAAGAGRRLVFPLDPAAASASGLAVEPPREGEWYASPDVPTSPLAGALSGIRLEGLPPLTGVMVPESPVAMPPLLVQLRGAGSPASAFALLERDAGRSVVVLASGFWRWAMRDGGRDAYRRVWSGVVGWLLADRSTAAPEPRPVRWVFDRDEPVTWRMPADSALLRVQVRRGDTLVADTVVSSTAPTSGALVPGAYAYTVLDVDGDTSAVGRFDVASTTLDLLPRVMETDAVSAGAPDAEREASLGPPLRTTPWPYLLVIVLLCGEWIVRRRIGLR